MTLESEFLLLLSLILFVASLIHTSIGFGFALISTPLLALFIDLHTVIIYTLIPTFLVNLVSILSEGDFLKALKRFYPLALFAMLGTAIGTQILLANDTEFFKVLLAFAILFYLFMDFVKINIPWIRNCPTCSMRIFGLSAGVLSGLTNAMAPVLMIYTLESKFTKSEIIQASNICFLFGKIIQILLFSLAGSFHFEVIEQSYLAIFLVIFALFMGIKIKKYIQESLYKRVVKIVLFMISIALIVQAV